MPRPKAMSRSKKGAPRDSTGQLTGPDIASTNAPANQPGIAPAIIVDSDEITDQDLDDPDNCMIFLDATHNATLQSFVGNWEEHAKPRRRVYDGQSSRSLRRKAEHTRQAMTACPMQPLSSWYPLNDQSDETTRLPNKTVPSHRVYVDELMTTVSTLPKSNTSMLTKVLVLVKFFEYRGEGMARFHAGERAALCLPKVMQCSGRSVESWAKYYIEHGKVPDSMRGKHQKTASLLHDEDFQEKCASWLRVCLPSRRTPHLFMKHLNDNVVPFVTGAIKIKVSENTARRWMLAIGYKYGMWKQDIYFDGHEREDVVAYRKVFCQRWLMFFERMTTFGGDNMDVVCPPSDIMHSEIVWVTHDESVFYANDDGGKLWTHELHRDLPKKSRGRSVMVSDFLCPCHGRLYNTVDGKIEYVCTIIHVGKDHDGYWTNEHLMVQMRSKVLTAFTNLHPNAVALYTFDQSTNHGAFASDALRASAMNLGPGGAQPSMRHGWFGPHKTPQSMTFPLNDTNLALQGKPKGLRVILQERGLWRDGLRLKCKNQQTSGSCDMSSSCCARHLMAAQADFYAQQSQLEETIRASGHECIFLPKYHCELNPIESYWGAAKRFTRANCDYSWAALQDCVPRSLEQVRLSSIRKYFRRCGHFIQSYSDGCDYKLTRFAHKKYKSHRRVPLVLQED